MTRRIFCKVLLVVVTIFGLLVLSGVLSAQGRSENAFERVRKAQERHTERLMAMDGVEGTAIGLDQSGQLVVKVFTARPGVAGIAKKLDDVPVHVVVTGKIYALAKGRKSGKSPKPNAEPLEKSPLWCERPVPIGVSTGHPDITAGTIACRVTNGTNVYALSNNHVYANENRASIGDNVLQPGTYDGGVEPDDAIGTLAVFEPIVFSRWARNEIDAAIALSSTANLGTATPVGGYGRPSSTDVGAFLGQQVQKFGRTTDLTKGVITGVNVAVRVGYSRGTARFVKQIIVESGTQFIGGGDSGSLLVTDDSDANPVGLLFAGTSDGRLAVANRIDLVLNRFGVTVDSEDAPSDTTPPTPDPMTWATVPYATGEASIAMVATTASDPSSVEYYFDETSGNPGGTDSGWQDSTSYEDTGLSPGTTYIYTVKARDKSPIPNETGLSTGESATTETPDTTAPTPDPMTWTTVPYATGEASIAMVATTASDPSGVEYYFDETSGNPGGTDSGWQDSTSDEDTGLSPGTTYIYTVKARDKSPIPNETAASTAKSAKTEAAPAAPAPVANFIGDPTSGYAPLTVYFLDISEGEVTSWSWDFGDTETSTEQDPIHEYQSAGIYTVSLTATGLDGSDTETKTNFITVSDTPLPPVAGFTGSPTSGDAPLNVQFTDESTENITSWSWDFGDGGSSTQQNPSHTYGTAGVYTVGLTVTGPGGSDTETKTDYINVTSSAQIEVFSESFESSADWTANWSQDSQRDWRRRTSRKKEGNYAVEVDGRATNAQLISIPINLQGKTNATITFWWYIERGLDTGEYLAFDVSTNGGSSWTEKARLRGNVDPEDTWHNVSIDVTTINNLRIRFRGTMSRYSEDAYVDVVKVVAW